METKTTSITIVKDQVNGSSGKICSEETDEGLVQFSFTLQFLHGKAPLS